MSDLLRSAYDPERFRAAGHAVVDAIADYLLQLGSAASRESVPVRQTDGHEGTLDRWPGEFPEQGEGDLRTIAEDLLRDVHHLQHPRTVGHQLSTPLPTAALADLLTSITNNSPAIFEMGPVASVVEHRILDWLGQQAGFDAEADGLICSGGSLGNMVALLAMRRDRSDRLQDGEQPALLVSEHAHYCVGRAVRILGWDPGSMIPVPTDDRFRMDGARLEGCLQRAHADGRRVLAVVSSAGTTATGSIDPIDDVAEFCARHDLWHHVDGAHGASFLLEDETRERLRGIHRCDSLVWDAHKMMMMPSLVTAVLFRRGHHAVATFAQEASYLFLERDQQARFDLGHRTLECTKNAMAFKLWLSLRVHGVELFREHLRQALRQARQFADQVRASEDFELACDPELNIVCFRDRLQADQARLRRGVVETGAFYLTQTDLRGATWLRCAFMNPATGEGDTAALLDALRAQR